MQRDIFYNELNKGLSELSLCLSGEQKEQLFEYYSMVVEKNKVMNLTAITEEREFVIKHIIDSLSIVKLGGPVTDMLLGRSPKELSEVRESQSLSPDKMCLCAAYNEESKGSGNVIANDLADCSVNVPKEKSSSFRLVDIGTGAGMPGVILKIVFPSLSVVLFDSLKKRLNFLDEVIEALSLKDIETLHGRAEDMGQDKNYRESFDLAVSRAVARLNVLSEYSLPFVKLGGAFIPYKSGDIAEELKEAKNAIAMLGGHMERDLRFLLPDSDMERSLLYIRKEKPTPKAYPRKAGVPSKKPIM